MNGSAAMLFAARTAAWTLLFGGWLVLGALALHHGPAGALQFAPLALWLGAVALAQRALLRHPPGPWALRGGLLAAGAVAAAGVATSAWVPAALGWGVLLVLASTVVRRRRGAETFGYASSDQLMRPGLPPPSRVPKVIGAVEFEIDGVRIVGDFRRTDGRAIDGKLRGELARRLLDID
jgi:hypothetical protein